MCGLLSGRKSPFATSGFNDCTNALGELENGTEHRRCMRACLIHHKESGSIDSLLLEQYRSEQEYWQKVLTRVVSMVHFLASRGLPFHGENKTVGPLKNGNYLGIPELLRKFDHFVKM